MLVIRPTADGQLHVSNNHRSETVASESAVRSMAYHWGHTELVINKALAEMRSGSTEPQRGPGWRVLRPEAAVAETRGRSRRAVRAREAQPITTAEEREEQMESTKEKPTTRRGRKRAAPPAVEPAEEAAATPEASTAADAPAAKATPRKRASRSRKKEPATPESPAAVTEPEKPRPADGAAPADKETKPRRPRRSAARKDSASDDAPASDTDRRGAALLLARQLAAELSRLEGETLPFARGPWTDLREMTEYVAACLQGKRPVTSWSRDRS